MLARAIAVWGLVLAAATAGCSLGDQPTTRTVVVGSTGATGAQGASAGEDNQFDRPTLAGLWREVVAADNPAYFNGWSLECVSPRTTPVPQAQACMAELRRWYQERRGIEGSTAKYCSAFYRYVCIPDPGNGDWECPELQRYIGPGTVEVSRYADPYNLDEDRDRVGCEP